MYRAAQRGAQSKQQYERYGQYSEQSRRQAPPRGIRRDPDVIDVYFDETKPPPRPYPS